MFSAFPYIGGKTKLAGWISQQLPEHVSYVEPFGGSAAVLLNKPRSPTEIFNDLDGDVVHFFDVARRRPEELQEWCRRTPFSEQLHDRWTTQYYTRDDRPSDPIERAGRWFFLRYSQFAGKVASASGFKRERPGDVKGGREAKNWATVPERIGTIADRFAGVSVTDEDALEVIERYDDPSTVFYVDPPYLDKEDLYTEAVAHDSLADALADVEGYALVSYTDLPESFQSDEWELVEKECAHNAGATGKEVTERLACNFDPDAVADWSAATQTTLTDQGWSA